ncbi:MAG: aspartyl/asparaginyl beta-hydroxylase domain-containing protein [Planctomycetes bacterium]|nr:aspartyl/asparaginyl beta-hydroxylase domain-containing protein [Planctomycetota bacterium]
MTASPFHDAAAVPCALALAAAHAAIRAEVLALRDDEWPEAPDSLTSIDGRYDERGWRYYALLGTPAASAAHRRRCPATTAVCAAVPGLVNAGFSRFLPGTHLYPHRGELAAVLRCHLGLVVPAGDAAIRFGAETRRWQEGRCLVFDDTFEHEAWNHTAAPRDVLIVTFRPAASCSRPGT